jgi:hypothetical protein
MKSVAGIRSLVAASLVGAAMLLPGLNLSKLATPMAAYAASAHSATALSLGSGTWYNFDHQTKNVTHIAVSLVDGRHFVHTYGACHPTDCDWGIKLAATTATYAYTTYHFSFADVTEYLYLSGPFLRVIDETHFIDNSGRADFTSQDLFYNPSIITHWVNTSFGTKSISRFTLSFNASGRGSLTAFGACVPTDCPWGTQASAASTPPVPMYVYYDQGFAQKEVVLTGNGLQVQAQTFVRFTDNSGRANYHTIENFAYVG